MRGAEQKIDRQEAWGHVYRTFRIALRQADVQSEQFKRWVVDWTQEHHDEVELSEPFNLPNTVETRISREPHGVGLKDLFCDDSILRCALIYLEKKLGRPDLAEVLRTSAYHVALRHRIVYEPHPPGTPQHGKLDWLLRPSDPARSEATQDRIRDWRWRTQHGDAPLYDHGKALFMFLQNSPLHRPYLRRFALSLASTAITYNDYGDALTIARWYAAQIGDLSKGDIREIPTRRDVHHGNRIFASAESYLYYTEPFEELQARFDEVIAHIEKDKEDGTLSSFDWACLRKEALRCLVRHAVNYRLRSVVLLELRDIPFEERRDLVDRYKSALETARQEQSKTTGLEYDTLCRAHAALLGDFDAAEDDKDDATARFTKEEAEADFFEAVPKARLNMVWRQITECVLAASRGLYSADHGTRVFKGGEIDVFLDALITEVQPENMRHSRNYEALLRSVSYSCKNSGHRWAN